MSEKEDKRPKMRMGIQILQNPNGTQDIQIMCDQPTLTQMEILTATINSLVKQQIREQGVPGTPAKQKETKIIGIGADFKGIRSKDLKN